MDGDAVQRIAVAVTPAVMVSACGLIALGLDNQTSRISLRLRELAREFRASSAAGARRELLQRQVAILGRRHGIMARALFLNYGAILAFIATSLLSLAEGLVPIPAALPLLVFLLGVLLLGGTATLAIASIYFARAALRLEERDVLAARSTAPAGAR